jgi:SAM-dependent methyltransferase
MDTTYNQLRNDCQDTLDRLLQAATTGMLAPSMHSLIERSDEWRRKAPSAWRNLVADVVSPHPLWAMAVACPMTQRARSKPRGYAGDAVMMDMIYDRDRIAGLEPSSSTRDMFNAVTGSPTCASVEYRRRLIAARIDALAAARRADGTGPIKVLSLACGHARELDLSSAVRDGGVARAVMCDQDGASLADISQRLGGSDAVETRALTVRQFIANARETADLQQFDFVYTAGLYDYLEESVAVRLTSSLFDRLAPGGQLLLANYHPDNRGTGYMEAFMDWWLIYRDDAQMAGLASGISPEHVAQRTLERDPFGNVVYLTLTRR